jgi:glutamate 5-kinase
MNTRDLSDAVRIVIKIGTNCLTKGDSIDDGYVADIAAQISRVKADDRQILIVSSGAIGMGARELGFSRRITDIKMRQACAAVGQPLLMHRYRQSFSAYGLTVAQVLLTSDVLADRISYLNLRNAVDTLLDLGVIPIFNENDSVSTAEIGSAFGDNDSLSAYVASKTDADLLIMLSDFGLFDRNPTLHPDAKPIHTVERITDEILAAAGTEGSTFGTGGMVTKLRAVEIAGKAGCRTVIVNGREERVIERILTGERLGTLFLTSAKLSARRRWILGSAPRGRIYIDDGAMHAIRARNSLLPKGVLRVEGVFRAGDVVLVNDTVKMVSSFNSTELESILGRHSSEIERILGGGHKDVIARPEDMVFIDE